MGFATAYLGEGQFNALVKETPLSDTGLIIIIPSFNEDSISGLLDSLASCDKPGCSVEVLIGINAPDGATTQQLQQNQITHKEILSWKGDNNNAPFRLFAFNCNQSANSGWGVGMARKQLMDEALYRFSLIHRSEGVIVSLDADCTVDANYLEVLWDRFSNDREINGASIRFEHSLPQNDGDHALMSAITEYELHLRYYYQGLRFTGFPDVFHTIGSAIAVRALAYSRVGGMNSRQAGEDFYFIQKMIPLGGFISINETTVYPSPRASSRVPFGTGPAVRSIINDPAGVYLTYHPDAFVGLKSLFDSVSHLYDIPADKIDDFAGKLSPGISAFLCENRWEQNVVEIQNNTSNQASFVKRFYGWFNMFRVVKYLNWVHQNGFHTKMEVSVAAGILLEMISCKRVVSGSNELLKVYRLLESADY